MSGKERIKDQLLREIALTMSGNVDETSVQVDSRNNHANDIKGVISKSQAEL
jgi:hypothetical protein